MNLKVEVIFSCLVCVSLSTTAQQKKQVLNVETLTACRNLIVQPSITIFIATTAILFSIRTFIIMKAIREKT